MTTLNPRAESLLKTLIERYIIDGQPVGSHTLAKEFGHELSPAAIRNVMADLEELGLIRSPHSSAGRSPTALGYRVFVDTLLKVRTLDATEIRRKEVGERKFRGNRWMGAKDGSDLLSVFEIEGLEIGITRRGNHEDPNVLRTQPKAGP